MDIEAIKVEQREGGSRAITVRFVLERNEDLEQDDIPSLVNILDEVNGAAGSRDLKSSKEETEQKPKRGRPRKKAAEKTVEEDEGEEDEGEPEKPRRRRSSKKAEETEEAEEKPKRGRPRKKAAEKTVEEDEGEPEKPRRRRRSKKAEEAEEEESGPTKEDVAKAVSEAAEILGSELTKEIVADYSGDGTLANVPVDKRQELIDELAFNMEEDE